MCGICGIIGKPDREALGRMMHAIRHRGPDDEGTYFDERAALGHRRLSIIDVAGGHQPMTNEDGTLHLVQNGEIYNHVELRRQLEGRGHRFATQCDSEVLVHLYEEYGPACAEHAHGMFAFAIWDSRRAELFMARDRLGIKPLFYASTPAGFLFASELKSILSHPEVRREIDPVALDLYLTFMCVPAPRTIIRNVAKLPPAHWLRLAADKVEVRRFWSLPAPEEATDERASSVLVDELRVRLKESVRERLMSDVPIGAYLSGGLDSSVVCALMQQQAEAPVHTFSVGFESQQYDERDFARKVAETLGTQHKDLIVREDALGELQRIIWHLDEPVADAAAIPTYQMARLTKQFATVVLTGEGADELFAGYPYYKVMMWGERLRRVLPGFGLSGHGLLARGTAFATALPDRAAAYLALKSVFNEREKAGLYGAVGRPAGAQDALDEVVRPFFTEPAREDFLRQLLRFETTYWLPDDLLTKVDRMTMAHAVEARVPYLEHHLVEFATRLPTRMRLRGLRDKVILREAARGLIPAAIRRRRKTGFRVPVAEWLRPKQGCGAAAPGCGPLVDLLSANTLTKRGFFPPDPAFLDQLNRSSNVFARRQLWTLVSLELWCRAFLDRRPDEAPESATD